jgi:alpha-L-fucosidase
VELSYPKGEKEKCKGKKMDHQKYIEYLHNQTHEILHNYGEVSELWFDFSSPVFDGEEAWGGVTLLEKIRKDNPNIIVNNRLFKREGSGNGDADNGTKFDYRYGDIITPEQFVPPSGIPGVNWESCMTLNDTWGYSKYDKNWKSNKKLIQTLSTIVSRGGNFLLNVGPKADGSLTQQTLDAFEAIGAWMDVNSESIKKTRASPFDEAFEWGVVTTGAEEGVLYVHVFNSAEKGPIKLPFKGVKKAEILGSSAAIEIIKGESNVELKPGAFPHPDVTVVKITT